MSFLSLFFSVAVCRFPNTGDDWYVLVGVARDMILNPRSVGGGFIYTYRLISGGEKLEFVHKVGLTLKGVVDQWKDVLFEKWAVYAVKGHKYLYKWCYVTRGS